MNIYVEGFIRLIHSEDWDGINAAIEEFSGWGRTWNSPITLLAIADDLAMACNLVGIDQKELHSHLNVLSFLRFKEAELTFHRDLNLVGDEGKWPRA